VLPILAAAILVLVLRFRRSNQAAQAREDKRWTPEKIIANSA